MMSYMPREFIGGPLDGELRVVSSTAVFVTAPHPSGEGFCKYGLYKEDMMFIDSGSKEELLEKILGS